MLNTVSLYPGGATYARRYSGVPVPGKHEREASKGWTRKALANNRRFLMSVYAWALDERIELPIPDWVEEDRFWLAGELDARPDWGRRTISVPAEAAYALTLTQRECPATGRDYEELRRAFRERLNRMGLIRSHWLKEFHEPKRWRETTRAHSGRGGWRFAPHMHWLVFLPAVYGFYREPVVHLEDGSAVGGRHRLFEVGRSSELIGHWSAVAGALGVDFFAQTARRVDALEGWMEYVATHAYRGAGHLQRAWSSVPPVWRETGNVGGMWNHTGHWPRCEKPVLVAVSEGDYFAFRRRVRSLQVSKARSAVEKARKAGRKRAERSAIRWLVGERRRLRVTDRDRVPARVLSQLRGGQLWGATEALLAGLDFLVVQTEEED